MNRLRMGIIGAMALTLCFVAGSWIYIASNTVSDIESLLICSQGKDEWVPKRLCQGYLFNFGANRDEVAELNRGIGIGWVIHADDKRDRTKLVEFLLRKGVDINALDQRSGISVLHSVVLENDPSAVEFLLDRGANPTIKDRDHQKTPLEFAQELKDKPNQPDRTAIIRLLVTASTK